MKTNIQGSSAKKFIEEIIFGSKWLLIPFYLVLILALAVYTWFDIKEFFDYLLRLGHINKESAMITFIELIDITMVANLGKMIITGSYTSFVNKFHANDCEQVSSGMLKVKMASSLVGVTAIQILARSIETNSISWDTLHKLIYVHCTFLVSVLILAFVDYLHMISEKHESKHQAHMAGKNDKENE